MNNKPVAWAIKADGDWFEMGWDDEILYEVEEWYKSQGWQYEYVPLYTHPVKELTDAEIQQVSHKYHYTYNPDYIGFARAILRKAQEK